MKKVDTSFYTVGDVGVVNEGCGLISFSVVWVR